MTKNQKDITQENISLPPGIYLRKDGRYQARYTYNGKRYTIYDRDLKSLCKKYFTIQTELEKGIYNIYSNLTLNQWFQIWITDYKSFTIKDYTLTTYIDSYNRYIKEPLGACLLKNIHTLQIQQLFTALLSNGLSNSSVQYLHTLLKGILKQAVQSNVIVTNPSLGVSLPKSQKKPRRVLSIPEQNIFLEAIETNFYRSLYMMALSTGLRIGEVTGLIWDDIDFEQATLTVNRTLLYYKNSDLNKFTFQFQTPKSSTSKRIVPIIPEMLSILEKHKKSQEELSKNNPLWCPNKGMEQLVFTTRNGKPLQEVYLFKNLASVVKEINLEHPELQFDPISPHTLRHTFATRAFENNLSAKTVQELLGHSSISITMDLYTHVTNDIKVKEMKKLSNIFNHHINDSL